MFNEGYKFNPVPQEIEPERAREPEKEIVKPEPDSEELKPMPENVDFSVFLGEGFTNEYFADKLQTFPNNKMTDGWNAFLLSEEGENFHDKTIEVDPLERVFNKLTGTGDGALMLPVFVQGIQSYYKNRNIPFEHVTPERVERFYNQMCAAGQ